MGELQREKNKKPKTVGGVHESAALCFLVRHGLQQALASHALQLPGHVPRMNEWNVFFFFFELVPLVLVGVKRKQGVVLCELVPLVMLGVEGKQGFGAWDFLELVPLVLLGLKGNKKG